MSKSTDNLILLGVIGLGAFFIMSRPGMANGLAPRPQQQQGMNAAQWASAIAGGIGSLFKGGSSGAGNGWTKGNDGFWVSPGGYSTNPKNPTFMGPPTAENQPIPNWGSYTSSGNDGLAVNPANSFDPWGWEQYIN